MTLPETIAAQATAPGHSGIGVIRVSGPSVKKIAEKILGCVPKPRLATYLPFKDENGIVIDQGIAIFFPTPNSFTGEDTLEFQGHGGPVVLDYLLKVILQIGARLARPGEFSERAFLNNKLDLTQAEAIADLIHASSEQAVRSAIRSLQGDFSSKINDLLHQLITLRIYVEAAIDFPEEEIDFISDGKIEKQLQSLLDILEQIKTAAIQGSLLSEGVTAVIIGKPNAGKSSLLNFLSGQERAIVTDTAGTTRDVLRESINIDGMPLHIVDTAGLRTSIDMIEQEGIRRAWQEIEKADIMLLIVDINQQNSFEIQTLQNEILEKTAHRIPIIEIYNKIDLLEQSPKIVKHTKGNDQIYLSAKYGWGIDLLKKYLMEKMGYQSHSEGTFIARRRHLQALERTHQHLTLSYHQLTHERAGELVAEELLQAQYALAEITGEFRADDLLGKIFSEFCIGK